MSITKEQAQRIIESSPVITQSNVPYKGVEITHIGFTNADGEPFVWDSGDEYAIVSFKALTEYQFNEAVQNFIAEDFDEAVRRNITLSVPVEKAQLWSKGVPGTLVCHNIVNNDGVEIMVAKTYQPAVAVDSAKAKRSLADVLAGTAKPAIEA
jgi:hypothetical protein